MRACQLRKEIYEPKKMEALHQNLVARSHTDNPQFYEIRVDGFTVVEKTSDPERFMNYADFIDGNTNNISVFLYYSANASDKFFFYLNADAFSKANPGGGLAGLESVRDEEKQKEKLRKELHYEQLIQENEDLKEEIAELERTIELIEEEKDTIKSNRDLGANHIAGFLMNGILGSKVVKDNFPFMENLSGTPPQQENTNQSQNTFKRKGDQKPEPEDVESEEYSEVLDDEDKRYLGVIREIKSRVGSVDLANVFHLLDLITANPHCIPFALKQVSNYLKQKPQAGTSSQNNSSSGEDLNL